MKLKPLLNKLLITLLAFLVLLSVSVAILPKAMQFAATYWLNKQGIETEIKDINIELYNGQLEIINAHGVNSQGNGFTIGHFLINLDLIPLLENTVKINTIELSDFDIDAVHGEHGIESIGGIKLAKNDDTNITPEDELLETPKPAPWLIELNNISLNNIQSCNQFDQSAKRVCTKFDSFSWNGITSIKTGESIENNLLIDSSATLKNISIIESVDDIRIFENGLIALKKFTVTGVNSINFDSLDIEELKVFPSSTESTDEPPQGVISLDSFKINSLHLMNQQHLAINSINITGIGSQIVIDKSGALNLNNKIHSNLPALNSQTSSTSDTQSTASEKQPLTLSINNLTISNSQALQFVDSSLNTPFHSTSIIKLLSLSNVDTRTPSTISSVKLNLNIDTHGEIDLAGSFKLLPDLEQFDITGSAKGIDLRPLSAYLEGTIGHKVKSGQLNADIKLASQKGNIDSLLTLDLKKFKLRATTKEEQEKLDKELGLGIPLDVALNLLRDSDDNIKLDLPITGNIYAPEFDPSDAITTAVSKALTVTIINYYTPFGLVAAAEGLFNLATALHFEPVIFTPGESNLTDSHLSNLQQLTLLMKQRPGPQLTLCGLANKNDLTAIAPTTTSPTTETAAKTILDDRTKQALLNIASKRGENIKQHLAANGIATDRLILCEPEYNENAISGVEIGL